MRTTPFLSLIFLVVFGFLIGSCETKVDLIDTTKEKAAVFGFLDPTVDTQFVKITKTFVTEGSAVEAAQDPEISEYKNLEAYVVSYDGKDTIDTYLLQEKTVTDKDSGAFYYPVQTVYYFTEPLNDDYEYEISFTGSGNDVSSKVPVVGDFIPNITINDPTVKLVLQFSTSGSTKYIPKIIKDLISSKNVRSYEFTFRYHYKEVYTDGTEKEKFMDFKFPTWQTETLQGGEEHTYKIEGEAFFQFVANKIIAENNEDNVVRREIGTMDYIFEYAGDDLNTFMELSQPSTSINIEQNPFSNLNNAVGVWSSRGSSSFEDKIFELELSNSYKEMAIGQYTTGLKFCSTSPSHNGTAWGCN